MSIIQENQIVRTYPYEDRWLQTQYPQGDNGVTEYLQIDTNHHFHKLLK